MSSMHAQTALVQVPKEETTFPLPLAVSNESSIPLLPSPNHVLIRVVAVALNPTDFKMITNFPVPGNRAGCDFCGIVEEVSSQAQGTSGPDIPNLFHPGARVCGVVFPYNPYEPLSQSNGAFAQFVVSDSRLLLKVPDQWSDLEGAALGGIGWATAGLAFYDQDALALQGRPSRPVETSHPVVVYGGGTASGTMAIQMLKLSGYSPIAICSAKSAPLAVQYGATSTADYTSATCNEQIKGLVGGSPIRHILDCITSADSSATCYAVMARTGGRYACLERLPESWRTRRAVKVKEVMGYEGIGLDVDLGPTVYSRKANPRLFEITAEWAKEMQWSLDRGLVRPHPIREVTGDWNGVIDGLIALQRGGVHSTLPLGKNREVQELKSEELRL
ncbi:Enoyl reductase LovC [Cytospora mali]|uniref:Enoyl reductase LovC n=1 Tax=Cytospora mali TaxID=578113 RepID=A0A194V8P0_CYTMA|nr:Enoyl reductase LovC [Valsa mali var. pyri (nom. inval.)]